MRLKKSTRIAMQLAKAHVCLDRAMGELVRIKQCGETEFTDEDLQGVAAFTLHAKKLIEAYAAKGKGGGDKEFWDLCGQCSCPLVYVNGLELPY